jgi:DinB superfamily
MPLPLDELVATPALVNERAQDLSWSDLLFEYELALDDDAALLGGLSEKQVHFKPAAKVFSIAEVLTHNCNSDQLFWNWLRLLANDRRPEIDPKDLIGGDGAQNDRSLDALNSLIEACRALARTTIDALPDPGDLTSTVPHPYFGALNAKGWIYFMCLHHGMHLRQAEQVIDTPGFPPGDSLQSLPRDEYLNITPRKPIDRPSVEQADKKPKRQSARNKTPPTSRQKLMVNNKRPATKAKTRRVKSTRRGSKKR